MGQIELNSLGKQKVRALLPHLPNDYLGEEDQEELQKRFQPHPEAKKMARMFQSRFGFLPLTDSDYPGSQLALVHKNHPYLLTTPYEAMVQYLGARPNIATITDWRRQNLFYQEQAYFTLVYDTAAAMQELVTQPNKLMISTNTAPLAKGVFQVQSVGAPHTHLIAYTEPEVTRSMETIQYFKDLVERRRITSQNNPISQVYVNIISDLLPYILVRYGYEKLNYNYVNHGIPLRNRTEKELPLGFKFDLDNLSEIKSQSFLNRVFILEQAMLTVYNLLAKVFLVNPEQLLTGEKVVLNNQEERLVAAKQFLEIYGPMLNSSTQQNFINLIRHFGLLNLSGQVDLNQGMTKGLAYSTVLYPIEDNPDKKWRCTVTPWLFGGGGIEGWGIEKTRIRPGERGYEELLALYEKQKEQRTLFSVNLSRKIQAKNPLYQSLL